MSNRTVYLLGILSGVGFAVGAGVFALEWALEKGCSYR